MKKWIRKQDVILIISLLLIGIIILVIWRFVYSTEGKFVTVEQRDELIGTYPLEEDKEIEVEYKDQVVNKIIIKDGYCYMDEAQCPDHLCIKQGKIDKVGQTIVCLPNRVVVTVISDSDAQYDSIAT